MFESLLSGLTSGVGTAISNAQNLVKNTGTAVGDLSTNVNNISNSIAKVSPAIDWIAAHWLLCVFIYFAITVSAVIVGNLMMK